MELSHRKQSEPVIVLTWSGIPSVEHGTPIDASIEVLPPVPSASGSTEENSGEGLSDPGRDGPEAIDDRACLRRLPAKLVREL